MWRLSWSQLSVFRSCPFRWYGLRKMRWVPWETNIHMQVGSATHRALEYTLTSWNAIRRTIPEMLAVFSNYLKSEGISDPDTLQYWTISAQNMLQGWMGYFSTKDFRIEAVEHKIRIPGFAGIIDCVATLDGQRYIIDWKTSSKKFSQRFVDEDGQVTCYSYLDGAREDTRVAYGVLLKGTSIFQFVESPRTQEQVYALTEEINKTQKLIASYHSKEDPERKVGEHCMRCELYIRCRCEGPDDF